MRTASATPRPWAAVLLAAWCACAGAQAATSPDSAGLVGSSPDKPTLPFKLWARSPKTVVKPRRRDLREADLRLQLGDDFDARWMRTHAHFGAETPEGPRQSVLKLAALAAREELPEELAQALGGGGAGAGRAQDLLREWLVRRATCPVRYAWTDLGPYFWPRWVRRGQCADDDASASASAPATTLPPPTNPTPAAARNASGGGGGGGSGGGVETGPRSCSWPPGMRCVPSAAKVLQLLRWHCSVWLQPTDRKKKRRKRYRCQWLKVPYPVAEDCTCA
ncbi:hypothetical protein R5R35_007935 [Gryllus longicercus]|uniref:Noggin n=1 Tax=Gryllus longicercus TaxID=2509291 RepID=A0AAN9V2J4_9ORTH